MKKLSFKEMHKAQGGGFMSFFYDLGYNSRMKGGEAGIWIKPVYVGTPETLVRFHDKIRKLQQDDDMQKKQLSLMDAQIELANKEASCLSSQIECANQEAGFYGR